MRSTMLLRKLSGTVACLLLLLQPVAAQTWPSRPLRVIVGFTTGGLADVLARLVAQPLAGQLGQAVVIENRPGAATALSVELVAKSPADGYTLLWLSDSATLLPSVRIKLPYDMERDLTPVSLVAVAPLLVTVHPALAARTVGDLIGLAKARPDKLSFGSAGVGSGPHLAGEMLKQMAGIRIAHIPYKGGGDTAVANAAGQVELAFVSIPSVLPLLASGKLRALAVTGMRRSPLLPDVPTIDESGLRGYDRFVWNGVTGPAGLPASVTARLNAALARSLEGAEIRDALARQGLEAQTNTPEQFAALIKADIARNAVLVKAAGMQPE